MKSAKFVIFLLLCRVGCSPQSEVASVDFEPSKDPSTRSILKSPTSPTRIFHSISFSSDTKSTSSSPFIDPEKIKDLKEAMKYVYVNSEIGPIVIDKSFDYQISEGKFIIDYNLPPEFQEMIDANLPGLEQVKISSSDLAGLILFLSHHLNIISKEFQDKFIEAFSENASLINFLRKPKKKLAKSSSMNDLLLYALSNELYYTVEAFYAAFGTHCLRYFIKESIRSKDIKLFKRFHAVKPTYKPERILIWAIEFDNVPVYNEVINLVTDMEPITEKFKKETLILRLAISSCYFPGLSDRIAKIEKRFFDEALVDSIYNGNHLLFKEMIKNNNSYFDRTFNATVISSLRLIFWDNIPSLNLNSFVYQDDFESVYNVIIHLQSDDPKVLRIFGNAVPDMLQCGYYESAMLLAIYKENRDYLKLLLNSANTDVLYTVSLEIGGDFRYYGIWEFITGATNYDEIMKDLVSCNGFTILHAIANPDFPEELWSEIIERNRRHQYVEGEYLHFIEYAGFINDSDLSVFDLHNNTKWNLLELAILNFNYNAVRHLLAKLEFSAEQLESAKTLAEKVKNWVATNSFYKEHLFPRAFAKADLAVNGRVRHSYMFYDDEEDVMNPLRIYQIINSDTKKIVRILNNN